MDVLAVERRGGGVVALEEHCTGLPAPLLLGGFLTHDPVRIPGATGGENEQCGQEKTKAFRDGRPMDPQNWTSNVFLSPWTSVIPSCFFFSSPHRTSRS